MATPVCTMVITEDSKNMSRKEIICPKNSEEFSAKVLSKFQEYNIFNKNQGLNVTCPRCEFNFILRDQYETKVQIEGSNEVDRPVANQILADRNDKCNTSINISSSEIESVFNTSKTHSLKNKLRQKTNLSEKRLSKIRSLQRSNSRLSKKIVTLKDIVVELKKKRYFHTSFDENSLTDVSKDIFLSIKGKKHMKFTPAIRKFALTLNYYSPSGYKYVRKVLNSRLPHPSTIAKWYQTIDGAPGFTAESFRAIKTKLQNQESKNIKYV